MTTQYIRSLLREEINLGERLGGLPLRRGEFEGQVVIIKTLVNSDSTYIGPEGREVFKREAAFFNDLRHPQIVRFLAIMADSFSVVLEFMNEGSLDTFIKEKGPLGVSWPDRFNVMCDVSSAMKFLHDRNRNNGTSQTEPIIHQNIRSSNVLIERNDKNELRAKVTGFGFSSVKDMIEDKTALFGQKGKQRDVYSPPELHQSRKITWACDVYSYGVTMLEIALLTRAKDAIVDFNEKLEKKFTPPYISKILGDCLEILPQRRPKFSAVNAALEERRQDIMTFKPEELETAAKKAQLEADRKMMERLNTQERKQPRETVPAVVVAVEGLTGVGGVNAAATANAELDTRKMKSSKPAVFKLLGNRNELKAILKSKRIMILCVIFSLLLVAICVTVAIMVSKFSSSTSSSTSSFVSPTPSSSTNTSSSTASIAIGLSSKTMWGGANSYFIYALSRSDQSSILTSLVAANIKIIRIYISLVVPGQKKSSSIFIPDVEPVTLGVFDDTILKSIDNFLKLAHDNSIKVIISPHDRNALGRFVEQDIYATTFKLPSSDASSFYSNPTIVAAYQARIAHILNYKSSSFSNRPWGSLGEVIYAFDVQSEPQAYDTSFISGWTCSMASMMKPLLSNGVLVASGGGADFSDSLSTEYFQCSSLDIVAFHSISNIVGSIQDGLSDAYSLSISNNKLIVFEAFGYAHNPKSGFFQQVLATCTQLGIPWVVWEVMIPNNYADYEMFIQDSTTWQIISDSATLALRNNTAGSIW